MNDEVKEAVKTLLSASLPKEKWTNCRDAIYMCEGWQNSKGCMAEFEVARVYGKEIIE